MVSYKVKLNACVDKPADLMCLAVRVPKPLVQLFKLVFILNIP